MVSTRNWSDAPAEIIEAIAERLASIEDCASFRGVCRSWRSAVLNLPLSDISSKSLPWIMFPRYSSRQGHTFWSVSMKKFYKLNLPDGTGRVLSGSQYGYLVLSRGPHLEIFNPLTSVSLPLPPLSTLRGYTSDGSYSFNKIILAASHAKDRFLVFVIFSGKGKLAFTRLGDKTLRAVNVAFKSYDDILHMNNQVYVVDTDGRVIQFNIRSHCPTGTEFASPPAGIQAFGGDTRTFYLVEILGKLYMVLKLKIRGNEYRSSHFFRVFKLDLDTREWEEVFTLGDYAIFVGCSASFSLLVSQNPELKSSICFMERYFGHRPGSRNMGIFNLETRDLVALDPEYNVVNFFWIPLWLIPNFC